MRTDGEMDVNPIVDEQWDTVLNRQRDPTGTLDSRYTTGRSGAKALTYLIGNLLGLSGYLDELSDQPRSSSCYVQRGKAAYFTGIDILLSDLDERDTAFQTLTISIVSLHLGGMAALLREIRSSPTSCQLGHPYVRCVGWTDLSGR